MQPVGAGARPAHGVGTEAAAWDRVVDNHLEAVWAVSREAGLDDEDAAVVSQLAWLRLAQRWPALFPRLAAEGAGAQLRSWVVETARAEARGLMEQRSTRDRATVQLPNVVCLSPGFQPPEPRSRRH